MELEELCRREGYGTSGYHAPIAPFTRRAGHMYGTCYNCKRPVRTTAVVTHAPTHWTTIGAYTVIEWP